MRSPGLLLLFAGLALAGCAAPRQVACPGATNRAARVFFATDRQLESSEPRLHFGPQRTDPPSLDVGWEEVALGPSHALGMTDGAVVITNRHEVARSQRQPAGTPLGRSDQEIARFVEGPLRQAIRASRPLAGQPRQVLLFVHGYNTTFDDALRKAAQLAGDLEMVDCAGQARGVAVAYSWPAQGTLLSYLADEENTEWTQQRLVPFLQNLSAVCREEHATLHLVSHSMGARALIRSLADIANSGTAREPLGEIILLAPDMGKGLFDQYLQRILPLIRHATIYVSAKDRALSLSRLLHGGHERLGLIESTLFSALKLTGLTGGSHRELAPSAEVLSTGKIDMIDVSAGLAGQFGHDYEDPAFIHDLREVIYRHTPAGTGARANLEPRSVPQILSGEKVRFFQMRTR